MKQLWRAEGVMWGARALRGKGLILEVIVGQGQGVRKVSVPVVGVSVRRELG